MCRNNNITGRNLQLLNKNLNPHLSDAQIFQRQIPVSDNPGVQTTRKVYLFFKRPRNTFSTSQILLQYE